MNSDNHVSSCKDLPIAPRSGGTSIGLSPSPDLFKIHSLIHSYFRYLLEYLENVKHFLAPENIEGNRISKKSLLLWRLNFSWGNKQ